MDINWVIALIKEGESERIEFKERPSQMAEEICALANAEGGYILIGVTDKGEIIGTNVKKAKHQISAALNNVIPKPVVKFHTMNIGGREILVVEVGKADSLCMVGGRAYIRIGTSKRPLSLEEILRKGSELALVPIDATPSPFTVEDLWEEALDFYKERLKRRGVVIEDVVRHLRKIGMVVGERLTLAAALLFTKEPQTKLPQAYLRIVEGKRWIRLKGPLWKLVEDAMGWLEGRLPVAWEVVGIKREEVPTIPGEALREAIVNALVHRNYVDFSETFIEVEGEKLRIRNPGGFPPGTDPQNPFPKPRNPYIYERMFEMGYVEKRGRGVELMRRLCASVNCNLYITSERGWTEVVFRPGEMDERLVRILKLLDRPKSSKEIAEALGVSKVTVLKLLKRLENMGLVEALGRSRSRRYRKR